MTLPEYQLVHDAAYGENTAHDEDANVSDTADAAQEIEKDENKPRVVFSSPAVYHPLTIILLSVAPIVMFGSIVLVELDDSSSSQEKQKARQSLLWSTVALIIVYGFVMPRRFVVLSDASIQVTTLLKTWRFPHVTAAYEYPSLFQDAFRPRFKFATDLTNRILIRRGNGGWDLLLSPRDVPGFASAVRRVAAMVEEPERSETLLDSSS